MLMHLHLLHFPYASAFLILRWIISAIFLPLRGVLRLRWHMKHFIICRLNICLCMYFPLRPTLVRRGYQHQRVTRASRAMGVGSPGTGGEQGWAAWKVGGSGQSVRRNSWRSWQGSRVQSLGGLGKEVETSQYWEEDKRQRAPQSQPQRTEARQSMRICSQTGYRCRS